VKGVEEGGVMKSVEEGGGDRGWVGSDHWSAHHTTIAITRISHEAANP
jgi:hypothetical protein